MNNLTMLEQIEQELDTLGVKVLQKNIDDSKGFSLKNDKKTYIIINKHCNKHSINFKASFLAHEHGHIITNAFYTFDTSRLAIRRREQKAIDYSVKRWINANELKDALVHKLEFWQIAELFSVDEDMIKHAICYYKRKNIL